MLKLFHMSECIFIEKTKGCFEQQALLYGSSQEFSDQRVQRLEGFFLASLKTLLTRKKQVWKQVVFETGAGGP